MGTCVLRMYGWQPKHLTADVGIMLGEKADWGKGYGTEAMRLLLTIVFDHRRLHRAELGTLVENKRAIRSFERCGFRPEGIAREAAYANGRFLDVLYMDLLKSEWDATKGSQARTELSGS